MADDLYNRRVKFNDGEGLDYTDLNLLQLTLHKMIFDGLLYSAIPDALDKPSIGGYVQAPSGNLNANTNLHFGNTGTPDFSDVVFTPSPGCGLVVGNGTRILSFVPGPLAVVLEDPISPAGDTAMALIRAGQYSLNDIMLTTAVGDPTNPRIDLVEVNVSIVDDPVLTSRDFEDAATRVVTTQTLSKTRYAQVTFQIKQGTPAATPTYPTPSAGYRPVAAVYIPANHNTFHSQDNIRDLRWPLGRVTGYDVWAANMYRQGGAPWTLSTTDFLNTSPLGGSFLYVPCPIHDPTARLVGIHLYGTLGASGTQQVMLVRVNHNGSGTPTITQIADLSTDLAVAGSAKKCGAVNLMDRIGAGATFPGTRAANLRVGAPLWGNSYTCGPLATGNMATHPLALQVQYDNGGKLSLARWFFAHGML